MEFASNIASAASSVFDGVHHSDSSSVSSSAIDNDVVQSFFFKDSVSPPPPCVFRTCVGGTLASDGSLKECKLRLRHRGEHDAQAVQLNRGGLCTMHHSFIQCTGCERSVHEGCWASECMQPSRRNAWTCDVCALKKAQEALVASESKTTVKPEAGTLPKPEGGDQDAKVTVLFKSRDSILKMFTKEGFRVRTSGTFANGLRWIQFDCLGTRCTIKFKCVEKENNQWHVTDFPESHPCCASNPVSDYHERTRTLPDDCLEMIQKLATSGAFDSKSIQKHLYATHGWNVSTDLIYMIGYRARVKMFGGSGSSDTANLLQQQEERRRLGDIYDLIYDDDGHLTHIVWVSSFAHLLLAYFDYFLCEGTHGISKYGWKFMPLCIVSSGDWIFPFAAVFGLEESAHSLKLLHAAIRRHCANKGVPCPPFGESPKHVPPPIPVEPKLAERMSAWAKVWLRSHLYPLEWQPFVVLSTMLSWQSEQGPLKDTYCETCGICGHNSKWCPKARKDHVLREDLDAYFAFLSVPVSNEALIQAACYACAISKQRFPTLHTDGGSAFGPLCEEVDRERTTCAIHMESKVAACNAELKQMVKRLALALLWCIAVVYTSGLCIALLLYFCIALAVVYTSGL